MPEIQPFRGHPLPRAPTRDAGRVLAPPYDVITPALAGASSTRATRATSCAWC